MASKSRSRFYVNTPNAKRDVPQRHSMFVSQSELDDRSRLDSSPASSSATLPTSSGSIDRLTGLGDKKSHRFFTLKPRRAFSSLRSLIPAKRRSSAEALTSSPRQDSGVQTHVVACDEVGVQTLNASTVDALVQTCSAAWEDDRLSGYPRRFSAPVYASARPSQVRIPSERTFVGRSVATPAIDSPRVSSHDASTQGIASTTDDIPKVNHVVPISTSNLPTPPDGVPKINNIVPSAIDVKTVPKVAEKSLESEPENTSIAPLPSCPTKDQQQQPSKPRDVDKEFEALLRDLNILTDDQSLGDLNIPSSSDRKPDKQSSLSPKTKARFDILLAPIPELESEDLNVDDSQPSTEKKSKELTPKSVKFKDTLEEYIKRETDAKPLKSKAKTKSETKLKQQLKGSESSASDKSEAEVNTKEKPTSSLNDDSNQKKLPTNESKLDETNSNRTSPSERDLCLSWEPNKACSPAKSTSGAEQNASSTVLTPINYELNRAQDAVYGGNVYDSNIKVETTQPSKIASMPTLPSFFEHPLGCSSASGVDNSQPKADSPREHQGVSVMPFGAGSEVAKATCSSNRSSVASGLDVLIGDSFKFDSGENLDQLEDEIIRSLHSPQSGTRLTTAKGSKSDDIAKIRGEVLDRLLSGETNQGINFVQDVRSNSKPNDESRENRCFVRPLKKYTATLIKMEHDNTHPTPENRSNCDYTSCLKPSQMQNSSFMTKMNCMSPLPQVERRTPAASSSCGSSTSELEYENCLRPSQVQNSIFTAELSEVTNNKFNSRTGSPVVGTNSPIRALPDNRPGSNESIPTPVMKSEIHITLRSPDSHSAITASPPPPPPPPLPDIKRLATSIERVAHSKPVQSSRPKPASPDNRIMYELEQKLESRQRAKETPPRTTPNDEGDTKYPDTNAQSPNSHYDTIDRSTINLERNQNGMNGILHENGYDGLSDKFHNSYNGGIFTESKVTVAPPPPGAVLIDQKVTCEGDKIHTDKYYAIPIKEVLKEKTSTTRFIPAPPKYEGIGPTEDGIPVGLRHSVKNMHNWYTTMYKSLHKYDTSNDTEEYIIGYTSEPEVDRKDKIFLKKAATMQKDKDISLYKKPYPASAKSTIEVYKVRPRLIEDYEPGHSSVTDYETSMTSRRYLPVINVPKPSYEFKNGFESDNYLLKKFVQPESLTTEEQKMWYKEIQKGGDVPPFGLGKPAPEKPRDPVIGPLPPPPLYYKQPTYQQAIRPLTLPTCYLNNNGPSDGVNGINDIQMKYAINCELQQRMSPVSQLSPSSRSYKSKSPDIKALAQVLFDFQAEGARELSLKKGDIVLVLRQLDRNWYEGEHYGNVGIFPISYVEILPPEHILSSTKTYIEGCGRALYDFTAHTNIELSFKKGDTLALLRRVDANWYEARLMGKKGIVPVVYILTIQEPSEGSLGSPSIRSITSSPRSSADIKERLQRASSNPPSPCSLKTPSPTTEMVLTSSGKPGIKKSSTLIEPIMYRALYNYSPQNADELALQEGDMVYVVEMCDDGWYVGTSVRTGILGIFPGNYVEEALPAF